MSPSAEPREGAELRAVAAPEAKELEQRARGLFLAALELEKAERVTFLDEACPAMVGLRERVEELLGGYDAPRAVLLTGRDSKAIFGSGEQPEPTTPDSIGGYQIAERVGAGGMGVVFRAEQQFPRRTVALKIMRYVGLGDDGLRRFRNEVETLGRLQHPGIAQVYDAGGYATALGEQPWFAMELVAGESITEFVQEAELDAPARCALLARVTDAVQHAHERHVVHRDLKPSNILVAANDAGEPQPKLLDFGVACSLEAEDHSLHTLTGNLVGTVPYMSPEQLVGDSAGDPRSDVYALGVILFELLTGELPFQVGEKGHNDFVRRVCEAQPRRLRAFEESLRGDLETICATALAKEPAHRYASARAFGEDLRRWLANLPIHARRQTSWYQLCRFAARNKPLVVGLIAAMVLLSSAVVVTAALAVQARENERSARRNAYAASVAHAMSVVETDPLAAEEHLALTEPEFRGFEWHYVRAQLDDFVRMLPDQFPEAPQRWKELCSLAYPAKGAPIYARARGGELVLTDVWTGHRRLRLQVEGVLERPVLTRDGRRLAAQCLRKGVAEASTEVVLMVWETATGRLVQQVVTPNHESVPIALRADGEVVAFARWGAANPSSSSGGVRPCGALVRVDTGSVLKTGVFPKLESPRPAPPTFCDGGAKVAIGSQVFATATGEACGEGPAPAIVWQFVQDNGSVMASARWRRRRIDLLDRRTGEPMGMLPGLRSHAEWMEFSPDGSRLAAVDYAGSLVIWDVGAKQILQTRPVRAGWLAFSQDGTRLAACTPEGVLEWDLEERGSRELRGHQSYVYLVAYSQDGSMLASVDHRARMICWDPVSGDRLASWDLGGDVRWIRFSEDGKRLFVLGAKLRAVDVATGAWTSPEKAVAPGRHAYAPSELGPWDAHSLDGSLWASAGTREVFVRSAAGDAVSQFSVGDVDLEQPQRVRETRAGLKAVHWFLAPCVALGPLNERVAAGHRDGSLHVFGVNGVHQATVQRHFGPVYDVEFSPSGKRIATAGNDGAVHLWDAESMDQVGVLRGHRSYVKALAFRSDGRQLATASGDGAVRLWDAEPASRRRAVGRARRRARDAVRARVGQLFAEHGARRTAEILIADEGLTKALRRASEQVLLGLATAGQAESGK